MENEALAEVCRYLGSNEICLIKESNGEENPVCDYTFHHPKQAGVEYISFNPNEARFCRLRLSNVSETLESTISEIEDSHHL